MPAAMSYTPDDSILRGACDKERRVWTATHQTAQSYFEGDFPESITPKRNPKTGAVIDHNVAVNLLAQRVDRRRDFLFKEFPTLSLDDVESESETEKWLRLAWDANKSATLWGLSVQNGAFDGHVYMRALPPREGRDLYPRCILVSNVIPVWQADDVDTVLWYEVEYEAGDTCYRQDIVDKSVAGLDGTGWAIYTYQRKGQGKWMQVGAIADWPYPLGPIVSWQHWPKASSFLGQSEFGDINLNLAVNRILSQGNAVIRNHAFPKTIVTGAESKKLTDTAVDTVWSIDNKDANVFNLEMQSDLSAILNYVQALVDVYNAQGRTVILKGGPADFTNLTNLAIKVAFMDQDDANQILQRQYGQAIKDCSRRLLMLAGKPFDVEPTLTWKSALPESKAETALVVQAENTLGLASKETQASQMGLNWQQEKQRMADEGGATPPGQPVKPGAQAGQDIFTEADKQRMFDFYNQVKQRMSNA